MPLHDTRRLELGQHAIDRGQAYIFVRLQQRAVNILRTQMAIATAVQDLQDPQSRQGCLEASFFERKCIHRYRLSVRA